MVGVAERSACAGGAVEIAVTCLDWRSAGTGTIATRKSSYERVQNSDISGGIDAEESASPASGRLASAYSGAIEVFIGSSDETGWKVSVGRIENVKDSNMTGSIALEQHSAAIIGAIVDVAPVRG